MWKNPDTDSYFDENSKSRKPAHPPPAAHYLMIPLALISGDTKLAGRLRTSPHLMSQAPPFGGPCHSLLCLTAKIQGM